MGKTKISWATDVWNPVRGCSRVSEGCRHCYAEVQAARIVRMSRGKPSPYDGLVRLTAAGEPRWTGAVRLVPEHLADPLRWKKPRRVFVNSMSDLFHESLTNEQIAAVFGVMAAAPQHTFQCLTKRPARMREFLTHPEVRHWIAKARAAGETQQSIADAFGVSRSLVSMIESGDVWAEPDLPWPLPNCWLGVSVENQEAADERIPELLHTPATVRFLSCEPLLGPVDLRLFEGGPLTPRHRLLHWCIAGCESGPGARPCDVEWLRSLRDQCADARVPFFLKQAEESTDLGRDGLLDIGDDDSVAFGDGSKLKARRPGGNYVIERPYLDGRQHLEFPEVTQ